LTKQVSVEISQRSAAPAQVLLADDDAATRAGLEDVLAADQRFEVCGSAADAVEAVRLATRLRPDLCLLDIRMPGDGIAAAWQITARLPSTRVVMLTTSRDDRDLFAALRAGARGYLPKELPGDEIRPALHAVLDGEAALPGALVTRLVEEFRDRAPRRRALVQSEPGPRLTSREWEVLDLMRNGLTTAAIAKRLFVAQVTVRSHAASAVRKLRAPNREAAIRMLSRSPARRRRSSRPRS
jgi:two-component system, NarL family, nitrate/nitrite response regulator NarL